MMPGNKADAEKVPIGLIPRGPLEQTAAVLAFGREKYGAQDWRSGVLVQRTLDAALRHIFASNEGETDDPESGLPHLAHAICCLMFAQWTIDNRPDLDDRWRPDGNELSSRGYGGLSDGD